MAVITDKTDRIFMVSELGTLSFHPKVIEIASGQSTYLRVEGESYITCEEEVYESTLNATCASGHDICVQNFVAICNASTKPLTRERIVQIFEAPLAKFWIAKKHFSHDGWQLFPALSFDISIRQMYKLGDKIYPELKYGMLNVTKLVVPPKEEFLVLPDPNKTRVDYLDVE